MAKPIVRKSVRKCEKFDRTNNFIPKVKPPKAEEPKCDPRNEIDIAIDYEWRPE